MKTIPAVVMAIAVVFLCGCATVTVPGPGDCNLLEISIGVKERPAPRVRVVQMPPPKPAPIARVEAPKPKAAFEEPKLQPARKSQPLDIPPQVKPLPPIPSVIPGPVRVESPSASETASRLIAHAYRRYTNMDYAATRSFSDYVADLTDLPAKDRAAGCILSGAARYLEGNGKEADQYFGRAKALAPYTKPSASVFPKEILNRYAAARPVHFWPRPATSLASLPNFLRQGNVENLHGE